MNEFILKKRKQNESKNGWQINVYNGHPRLGRYLGGLGRGLRAAEGGGQTSFFLNMAVEFSDSHPTLYVVSRLGSVLFGPRRTGLALPWTTYRAGRPVIR